MCQLSYQILHSSLSSYFLSSVLIQDLFSPSHINIVLTLCWLPLKMSSFIPISSHSFHHPEVKHVFSSFFLWVHVWIAAGKFTIFFICFPHGLCLFSLKAQDYYVYVYVCAALCVCKECLIVATVNFLKGTVHQKISHLLIWLFVKP